MNNDLYAEWIVKRQNGAKELGIKVALIALIVVGVFTVILFPTWGIFIAIAAIVLAVFGFQGLNVEYEYIFVTDELQITPILNQQRRRNKKRVSIDMQKVISVAPMNGHELDPYANNDKVKKVDFSSGVPDAKIYGIVVEEQGEKTLYKIEPNEKILQVMRNAAPRKVKLS
ncbi:MAG: DUF6106 family protein [Clostridiales bacterium]|nr:DUF6106 family protein [Clostridiales bacterium]